MLIDAIKAVAAGDSLLSPSVTRRVIDRMAALPGGEAMFDDRLGGLTAREREVLEQLARGLSNAEIAGELVIEESTLKTHVARILMKLHLREPRAGGDLRVRERAHPSRPEAVVVTATRLAS